jgi:MFS family permease
MMKNLQVQVEAVAPVSTSGRWALASLALPMLLSALGTSIANVGLPTLVQAFDASFQAVQWVVLAYLLAVTTLVVSAGRLGDALGQRRLMLAGLGLFTVASALCSLAPTLGWLIAARALQGLGAAVMMALTLAFVGEMVPKAQTGRAMGLLATLSATGTALGPSLGGVLIAADGWPALFYVNVPLGMLALGLAYRHLPADRRIGATEPGSLDPLGSALLALTLAAYALAMTLGRGHFGVLNGALLLAAMAGLAAFVRVEAKAASPLIRPAMFRDVALSISLAASALVATVMMATLVVGPFHLARGLGLDAVQVGLAVSVGPLVVALAGVPAGRITDRFGARRMTLVGLLAMGVGAFTLALLPASLGLPGYLAPLIVITAGYALFQTANNTVVMVGVSGEGRGLVSGLLSLSRNLGLITGASLMGAVFMAAAGGVNILAADPGAVVTATRITFGVAGGLVLVALGLAGRRLRREVD